jgi:GTPase SAR1 family protein
MKRFWRSTPKISNNYLNPAPTPAYTKIKIEIIGGDDCGKTSLQKCFVYGNDHKHNHDIMVISDMDTKIVDQYKLIIHNYLGIGLYKGLMKDATRNADVVFLCFDLSSTTSFGYLQENFADIFCNPQINKILVGLKNDLPPVVYDGIYIQQRAVELAREYKMDYLECSAKNNKNVEEIFNKAILLKYPEAEKVLIPRESNGIILDGDLAPPGVALKPGEQNPGRQNNYYPI